MPRAAAGQMTNRALSPRGCDTIAMASGDCGDRLLVAGVPLTVQKSRRARRISLRLDAASGGAVLVLPLHLPMAAGLAFAHQNAGWLAERHARLPSAVALADGAQLPLLGLDHVLRHRPDGRRGVWIEDGAICVSGAAEHFRRRLNDWLRERARDEILHYARPMAADLGVPLRRITLRDTRSRWGSCSRTGDMSFSWRLILAPREVLAYVVAHETCHRLEMNHSPAFWRLVERLAPGAQGFREWLKREGARLHRYG